MDLTGTGLITAYRNHVSTNRDGVLIPKKYWRNSTVKFTGTPKGWVGLCHYFFPKNTVFMVAMAVGGPEFLWGLDGFCDLI